MAEFSVNIEKMEEVAADAEQVSRILGEKLSELEAAGKASGESMRLRIR